MPEEQPMSSNNTPGASWNEQSRLINIALKHTAGDMDKARLMASGSYNDAVAIKGKFSVEQSGIHGVFLVFLNLPHRYIMNIGALLLPSGDVLDEMRIFDGWKLFHAHLGDTIKSQMDKSVDSYDFVSHFSDSLEGYNIYEAIESGGLEGVTQTITEIILKFYDESPLRCQVDSEETSSLSLELEGIPIELPSGGENDSEPAAPPSEAEKRTSEIERQADHVIKGRIIVSPVHGKYINDIKAGDNIKVQLVNQDDVSLNVAKLVGSLTEDGEFLPIKGRVKEKVPLDKGYALYTVVAKNVLAKIVEEENVKIEMDSPGTGEMKDRGDSRLILYLSLIAGLLIFTLLIIFALL
jgi:hypothetical protein